MIGVIAFFLLVLAYVIVGASLFAWSELPSPTMTPPQRVWVLIAYVVLWPFLWLVSLTD